MKLLQITHHHIFIIINDKTPVLKYITTNWSNYLPKQIYTEWKPHQIRQGGKEGKMRISCVGSRQWRKNGTSDDQLVKRQKYIMTMQWHLNGRDSFEPYVRSHCIVINQGLCDAIRYFLPKYANSLLKTLARTWEKSHRGSEQPTPSDGHELNIDKDTMVWPKRSLYLLSEW